MLQKTKLQLKIELSICIGIIKNIASKSANTQILSSLLQKNETFKVNELAKLAVNFLFVSQSFNENGTKQNGSEWREIFPAVLGATLNEIYENGFVAKLFVFILFYQLGATFMFIAATLQPGLV